MKTPRFLLAACVSLALALTFSCSSDDDAGGNTGGSGGGGTLNGTGGALNPCSGAVTGNGTVSCGGKTYNTVPIGDQVWMKENLDYDVPNSATDVCYGNDPSNCVTYGRLYNWATAMNLPSDCNSGTCSEQIKTKHRGICPDGWHIPSKAEWGRLFTYVRGINGRISGNLKAKTGWYDCGPSGLEGNKLCEDIYGFSALPGGFGYSDGGFNDVGTVGYWWSVSEDGYAYYTAMFSYSQDTGYNYGNQTSLRSVRCVQD
ncbi:MAG: hypothetical protein FWC15_07690 [Fibromonadales bacterium]|nr:hypothetical protein [Fibromonadales bacterium]